MDSKFFEENLLRRYLLGELSEDEQARIEDAAFDDTDLLAFVQTVENDLIDEYARGELNASERQNFELKFLTSAERRRKIEFARTLQHLETENIAVNSKAAISVESGANKKSFRQMLSSFSFAPQMAFGAVVLLILIGGALLLFKQKNGGENEIAGEKNVNRPPETSLPQKQSISNLPQVSPTVQSVNANEKTNQINSNIHSPVQPNANQKATENERNSSPAVTFAALIFPAGLTRDGGGKVLRLILTPTAKQARLVFNLEKGDEYKTYQVELHGKTGANISQSRLSRAGHSVVINIPADKLSAGRYEAVLRGADASGQSETIGYYDFEVVKP